MEDTIEIRISLNTLSELEIREALEDFAPGADYTIRPVLEKSSQAGAFGVPTQRFDPVVQEIIVNVGAQVAAGLFVLAVEQILNRRKPHNGDKDTPQSSHQDDAKPT